MIIIIVIIYMYSTYCVYVWNTPPCFVVYTWPSIPGPGLQAVAAQAMYDGGYWQSTGIGRYATGAALPLLIQDGG